MKTRILSIVAITATLILASCGPAVKSSKNIVADERPDGGAFTEKTVPVVTKVAPDGEVTLRFYDDLPDVAYISAADFQSIVLPGSTMTVTHTGIGEYTLANGDASSARDGQCLLRRDALREVQERDLHPGSGDRDSRLRQVRD